HSCDLAGRTAGILHVGCAASNGDVDRQHWLRPRLFHWFAVHSGGSRLAFTGGEECDDSADVGRRPRIIEGVILIYSRGLSGTGGIRRENGRYSRSDGSGHGGDYPPLITHR